VADADAGATHRHPLLCDPDADGIVRMERSRVLSIERLVILIILIVFAVWLIQYLL
jgi:hypothetical protein